MESYPFLELLLVICAIIIYHNPVTLAADCQNGGTVTGLACNCTTDWMGPNCTIAVSGTEISTILYGLPPLLAYWPFSSEFGSQDITNNHIDGVMSAPLATTIGPYGGSSNAITTTNSSGSPIGYVWFNSSLLNFGNKSWTLSTFVYVLNDGNYPIFEYENGSTSYGAYIWQSTTINSVSIHTMSTTGYASASSLSCSLRHGWQFVGIMFDANAQSITAFCNNDFMWSTAAKTPKTYDWLYFGHQHTGTVKTTPANFACASAFFGKLEEKQLQQVKLLCPLFQGISCPSTCNLDTCQYSASAPEFSCSCQPGYLGAYCNSTTCVLPCENGGTCVGPNKCNCSEGYVGVTCATALRTEHSQIMANLSAMIGYWPFTAEAGTRDVTNNHNDGQVSTMLLATVGPFGGSNTALQTTNASGSAIGHISFSSSQFLFPNSSWTISTFVKILASGEYPILEFQGLTGFVRASFRVYGASNGGFKTTNSPYQLEQFSCNFDIGVWQFVAATFVKTSNTKGVINVFCNKSFVFTTATNTPDTSGVLYFGRRITDGQVSTPAAYSCASAFSSALSENQLNQLKSLCPALQGIRCPVNCILESCEANGTIAAGYACICKPGYTGSDCESVMCEAPCLNGGSCTGPNMCDCIAGYIGTTCSTALRIEHWQIMANLPSLLGYWPLTTDGGVRSRDVTNNHNDGEESTFLEATAGPFGGSNTALQTTNASGSAIGHISFSSSQFLFPNSSWTISTFVKILASGEYPILEFQGLTGFVRASFRVYGASTGGFKTTDNPFLLKQFSCNFGLGVWQFVAATFVKTSNTKGVINVFCNKSFVFTSATNTPDTSSVLYFGRRITDGQVSTPAAYSCGSAFSSALSETQLNLLKSLCPALQGIRCPVNCILESCEANGTIADGYACICKPGYTGSGCESVICESTCLNGGTCTGPNKCDCIPGYIGTTCSSALPVEAAQIMSSLPPLLGYWPLTANEGVRARDVTNNHNDGEESTFLEATAGPFGGSNTALQTTNASGSFMGYVSVASDNFLFTNSSWTISTFVRVSAIGEYPILEFQGLTGDLSASIRVDSASSAVFNTRSDPMVYSEVLCNLEIGVWQFVAATYVMTDSTRGIINVFCNNSFVWSATTKTPRTGSVLYFGRRLSATPISTPAAFSCGSAFPSALNETELNQLKSLCPHFQGVPCPKNCILETCRSNISVTSGFTCSCESGYTGESCDSAICEFVCQNGGTCVGPNRCECGVGYAGSTCSIILTADASQIMANLPPMHGFWPFTAEAGVRARDVTNNHNDCQESTTLLATAGPFGGVNTALQTTNASGSVMGYVSIASGQFRFPNSSWTITTFVKMMVSGNYPILEFQGLTGDLSAYLRADSVLTGAFNTRSDPQILQIFSCNLAIGVWQFVAATYARSNNTHGNIRVFCNNSFVWSVTTKTPLTGSVIYFGRRITNTPMITPAAFSCGSVFPSALSDAQLNQLKSLCPHLQAIACSPNCILETCRANGSVPLGFTCTCKPGYKGENCDTTVCEPICQNGGTCSGPNKCTCPVGYIGPACTTVLPENALTILNSLPSTMFGFWPLTEGTRTSDVTGNRNDAQESTMLLSTVGPFGGSNMALQTTNASGTPMGFISVTSDQLLFLNSSWTISTFIRMNIVGVYSLIEFQGISDIGKSANLWQASSTKVSFSAKSVYGYTYSQISCLLNISVWQFVAISYFRTNSTSGVIKVFCNDTFVFSQTTGTPTTDRVLYFGRTITAAPAIAPAAFSCASVFSSALDENQLNQLKSLCPHFQVSCSPDCLNNGKCVVSNMCNCTVDYTGSFCEIPVCNLPCQNGGTCTAPNNCTCPTYYSGTDCSIADCTPLCGNGGTCINPPSECECTAGWNGTTMGCTIPICTSPCLNGGNCSAPDTCQCAVGWNGTTSGCNIPVCSPACSNGGTCTSPNVCTCATGWNGTNAGCNTPICSNECTNGGNCTAPDTCTCNTGWTGAVCDIAACVPACTNGGTCISSNVCSCLSGWNATTACNLAICLPSCDNGGSCIAPDTCSCASGYNGSTCETPICNSSCENGGTCSAPNNCTCTSYYSGPGCTTPVCSPSCANGGTCINPPSVCTCATGWNSTGCSSPICSVSCANGGTCTAPDACSCAPGWTGTSTGCNTPVCSSACVNGGTCMSPDVCACTTGWAGTNSGCNTPICNLLCGNGGTCVAPEACACATGWNGTTTGCDKPICIPSCVNTATCVAPNTCECPTGYTGSDCSAPICNPECKNGGNCSAPSKCDCPTGWNGTACDIAICNEACNNNGGFCFSPDTCVCLAGWQGNICQIAICSPSCANGGNCTEPPDVCSCPSEWTDETCSTPVCHPPCENGGDCTAPNVCSCSPGWKGPTCGLEACYPNCSGSTVVVQTDPLSVAYLANVSDAVFIASSSEITSAVLATAGKIASSDNADVTVTAGIKFLPDLTNVVKRFLDLAESLTLEQIDHIANDLSSAASQVMEAVTNATTSQPVTSTADEEIKCNLNTLDQQVKLTRDSATSMSGDQTVQTYDGFNKFVKRLLGLINANPKAGDKHRFDGGFFAYAIVCVELKDLPGFSVETTLASVTFPAVSNPLELVKVESALVRLNATTIVTIAVVGYIANVLDADVPFNMITSSLSVTAQNKDLKLNASHPVLMSTILENKKKAQVGREQVNAKCYINTIKCDPTTNADSLGTLQRFTLWQNAGHFQLIFPVIEFEYAAYIQLNGVPGPNNYTWSVLVTKQSAKIISDNGFLQTPELFYDPTTELRVLIRQKTISQFVALNASHLKPDDSLTISVFMKRNYSSFPSDEPLPDSACQLQKCYGHHLQVNSANSGNNSKRRRRDVGSIGEPDFMELEPSSSDTQAVFKSSYFGDFGANLVISPNTIEFSDVFANFATLLADNYSVFAFMIGTVVLFPAVLLFALRFDRQDIMEWAFLPLLSNRRDDCYQYLISVIYYDVKGFEQHPQVSLVIKGSIQDTEWRLLEDGKRKNFNGKRPANFLMSTFVSVGSVEAVQLRVKSTLSPGMKPFEMQLDKIIVIDVHQSRKYIFPAKLKLKAGQQCQVELSTEDDIKAFRYLVSQNSRVGLTDLHPWLSVAKRPLPSNWTRAERLGVVVSALFMAMLVNTMFYGQEAAAPKVGINVGGFFRISWFTIWTSIVGSVIIIPPTSIIAFIFKKIKRRSAERSPFTTVFNLKLTPESEDESSEKKKKPFQLPYWCAIIAWLLCGVCVAVSAFFIIMYSLTWGREKSLQWLVTMLIHVVQDIIIVQTIKVFVTSLFTSTFLSMPDDGLNVGRLTFAKENMKSRAELFRRMRNMVAGIFHHIIFVIAFAMVIGTAHNSYSYKQVRDLKPLVAIGGAANSLIEDPSQVFDWISHSLLSNFLAGNQLAYGGMFPPSKMYIIRNHDVVLMGPMRLRQQRTTASPCPLQGSVAPSFVEKYTSRLIEGNRQVLCQKTYADALGVGDSSEKRSFDGYWTHQWSDQQQLNNLTTSEAPWVYRDSNGIPYFGRLGQYLTGGYYVDLPLSLSKARAVVSDLKSRRWLDNATTVLFVDFVLYNAQVNIFIAVKIVFESLSAGGMSYHKWLYPLNLYQYSGDNAMMVYAVQAFWIVVLLTHTVKIVYQMKAQGFRKFCRDGWNWFDVAEVLFAWAIVGVFAARISTVISTVSQLQNDRYSFVHMDLLVYWEDLMLNMYGIAFFMAMLLFFRHLTSNKFWAMFLAVLSRGKGDIMSFLVVFVVITVLFAGLGYGTLGAVTEEFRSFTASFMTLIENVIGVSGPLMQLANTSRFVMLYCFAYSMIVMFLAVQVFMTIINVVYGYVEDNVETTTNWDHELAEYMSQEWKQLLLPRKAGCGWIISQHQELKKNFQTGTSLNSCSEAASVFEKLTKVVDRAIRHDYNEDRYRFVRLMRRELEKKTDERRSTVMMSRGRSPLSRGMASATCPIMRQPPFSIGIPKGYWAYLGGEKLHDSNRKQEGFALEPVPPTEPSAFY